MKSHSTRSLAQRVALLVLAACVAQAAFVLSLTGCLPAGATIASDTQTSPPAKFGTVKKGSPAPDFRFTTTDNSTSSLSAYQGKVVLLNLWASWCGPCVREMPDIERLRQDFPDLVVLAANVGDSPADAEKFIQNNDYGFMWTIDKTGDIAQAYPSDGIPYTVIIDKQGNVHEIFLGSPPDAYGTYRKSLSQLM